MRAAKCGRGCAGNGVFDRNGAVDADSHVTELRELPGIRVGSAVLQGPRATGEAIKPRVRARQQRNAAVNADERHAALPRRSKRRCVGRIVLHRLIAQRGGKDVARPHKRSEEHTSELQSLMRISYAVFCLTKKKNTQTQRYNQI